MSRETPKMFAANNPGNVWEVDRVAYGSTDQTWHIAVFPEEITERIVRACSRPDDLVLDPFLGSGTTAKVARSLGRNYVGIEISKEYFAEAVARVGAQQFGESYTILSVFLKHFLRAQGGRVKLPLCSDYLKEVLHAPPRDFEKRLLLYVESAKDEDRIAKKAKPEVWRFADDCVGQLDPAISAGRGLLANTIVGYREAYKLSRLFNGVQIATIACRVAEEILAKAGEKGGVETLLRHIVADEPFSLDVSASGFITLKKRAPSGETKCSPITRERPVPEEVPF